MDADNLLIPLGRAARELLPSLRGNRPVSPQTLRRWGADGIRGVRLQLTRAGGTWCTSANAVREFFAALTAQTASTPASSPGVGESQNEIERSLDDLGV
jgi:Protein of unknown function (DUF1580)